MITINLLECVQSELKNNGRCYADILDSVLLIKGDDFILVVRLARGYVSLLNFINLRVPKEKKDVPNFFSHRYGEYVGD